MDNIRLVRLRRAAEFAAIFYAHTHPGPYVWLMGELGCLELAGEQDEHGFVTLVPRWFYLEPTPIEIVRAVERAKEREVKYGS